LVDAFGGDGEASGDDVEGNNEGDDPTASADAEKSSQSDRQFAQKGIGDDCADQSAPQRDGFSMEPMPLLTGPSADYGAIDGTNDWKRPNGARPQSPNPFDPPAVLLPKTELIRSNRP
jgi:hypothetical protein